MTKRDSFLLRLSPELMDSIRRWAEDEFRSTNSQIEMVLRKALHDAGRIKKRGVDEIQNETTKPKRSNSKGEAD
ncbi:MAG: Arc family DNA-binding protein [Pirellula sp.]